MVQRKTVSVDGQSSLLVTTECMKDGKWSVVVNVKQTLGEAEQNTDLPVTHERFETQEDAEEHGIRAGREWVERNTSQLA
jgi:hypothetical protein